MYWIGYDIGSSSIKAALVNANDGSVKDIAQQPKQEMPIDSPKSGWAEQDPDLWWKHACNATQELIKKHNIDNISDAVLRAVLNETDNMQTDS